MTKFSHRDYTKGFYYEKPLSSEQIYTHSSYIRGYSYAGRVIDYDLASQIATIEQRSKFSVGEEIEFMPFCEPSFTQKIDKLWDEEGNEIESAPHPKQIVKMKVLNPVEKKILIRKKEK